jgi:hypothetical protein
MPPRKKKTEIPEPPTAPVIPPALVVDDAPSDKDGLEVLDSLPTQETPLIKTRAKREKRASKHKVVALVTADGIQGAFQNETRKPLIAHLPIHSSDVKFHDQPFTYDPRPPAPLEAFNAADIDPFSNEAAYVVADTPASTDASAFTCAMDTPTPSSTLAVQPGSGTSNIASSVSHPTSNAPRKEYGPTTLLVQFANTAHTHELPSETSLACFWCCETFTGKPCVIPTRIVETVWNVYGNFCTPQCCMAYILSEQLDAHVRWERIALLNRLYGNQFNGRIYPAPSRESLQRFGGPIPIDDFRAICDSQRIRVDIQYPPMVSILASMDTKPVDFYETTLRSNYLPQYNPQKSTYEQGAGASQLKLKRSKPLKEKESTLDACLNITIMSS